MKRNVILIALAILISMPVCGQINIFNAKKKQKELIDALSKIVQEEQATQQAALAPVEKEKEAIEKQYKGQTLYFITDLDYYTEDGYHIDVMSPNDTEKGAFHLRALSGKDAFCFVDTSIVKRNEVISKSAYVCTDVILVNHVDKYGKVPDAVALRLMGKNPDDLTIALNRGVREYPVVLYVYYSKAQRGVDAGWGTYIYGYNNTYGDILTPKPISVKVKTSLGEIESTYTHPLNLATDADLDSLVLDLQGKYKSKRDAQLAVEAEKKREGEAKKKQLEEKARMAAEAEEKKREEKAKFIAGLDEKSLKTYSGKMTSTPNWIEDIVKAHGLLNVISGTYSYFSIIEDDEEERIPHGQFLVICSTSAYSMWEQKYSYEIKGQFNRGKREGVWTIKAKNDKGEYPYDNYRFQYKNGVLNGDFCFKLGEMEKLQRSKVSGTFLNGKLVSISIKDAQDWGPYGLKGSSSITGDVNDKGNPHGKWTKKYESDPRQITYLFYNGCLLYERIKDESTGDVQYKYQASPQIGRPSDLENVHSVDFNTIEIEGEKYSKIYVEKDLWNVCTDLVKVIYPGFSNWCVKLEKCK